MMNRKKGFTAIAAGLLSLSLAACARESESVLGAGVESGLAAIEEAMTTNPTVSAVPGQSTDDLRRGTSEFTVATPVDFPEAYHYGTGKIQDYSRYAVLEKLPEPAGNETVLDTPADATQIQVLYLGEEGNVPAKTQFSPDMTGYFDAWDFRPYVTAIPVPEGVTPKGAVVLMAGGA